MTRPTHRPVNEAFRRQAATLSPMNDAQRSEYLRDLERNARRRRQWEVERAHWAAARHMSPFEKTLASAWLCLRRKIPL